MARKISLVLLLLMALILVACGGAAMPTDEARSNFWVRIKPQKRQANDEETLSTG